MFEFLAPHYCSYLKFRMESLKLITIFIPVSRIVKK